MKTNLFSTHINSKCYNTVVVLSLLLLTNSGVRAAQGFATTGDWAQNSTWLINGVNRTPACGDTLLIPASATVTLSTMENYYYCGQGMLIYVEGSFELIDGFKLRLPCGSSVVLLPGGTVRKATPGFGMSTYIRICHCDTWVAAQGPVTGPAILNCSVLPVSLIHFGAEVKNKSVHLSWATSTEINNEYFTVERSADSENFERIGRISGNGTTNFQIDYEFTDNEPLNGVSYYRLKQTDHDGTSSYSDIAAVEISEENGLVIYSFYTPNEQKVNVRIIHSASAICTMKVFDLYGREVTSTQFQISSGGTNITLENELAKGHYLLYISDGNNFVTSKIFVQ